MLTEEAKVKFKDFHHTLNKKKYTDALIMACKEHTQYTHLAWDHSEDVNDKWFKELEAARDAWFIILKLMRDFMNSKLEHKIEWDDAWLIKKEIDHEISRIVGE